VFPGGRKVKHKMCVLVCEMVTQRCGSDVIWLKQSAAAADDALLCCCRCGVWVPVGTAISAGGVSSILGTGVCAGMATALLVSSCCCCSTQGGIMGVTCCLMGVLQPLPECLLMTCDSQGGPCREGLKVTRHKQLCRVAAGSLYTAKLAAYAR